MKELWQPVWKCSHHSSSYLKAQNWGTEASFISDLKVLPLGESWCDQDGCSLAVAISANISAPGPLCKNFSFALKPVRFPCTWRSDWKQLAWVNVQEDCSHPQFLFVVWSFFWFYENKMNSLKPGSWSVVLNETVWKACVRMERPVF